MTPYYEDDLVTLHHGDCLDVLRELPDNSVDSVVTDPPYGLEFMGKEWDAPWQEKDVNADAGFHGGGIDATRKLPSFTGSTNPKCGACKGTRRGRRDGTAKVAVCLCADGGRFPNVRAVEMRAFGQWCELWTAECLRVLRPGGHLLAFGGTRTWYRLACAVEDAGFEVRDSIAWLYGSGFPKSLDVSKAIDKRPGVERHPEFAADLRAAMAAKGYTNTFDVAEAVIGRRTGAVANWQKYQWPEAKWWPKLRDLLDMDEDKWGAVIADAERVRTGTHAAGLATGSAGVGGAGAGGDRRDAPATDAARTWQGWGTALKPAFEPVVVARKPLVGTVAANVLVHGTGALNIDRCRVAALTPEEVARSGRSTNGGIYGDFDSIDWKRDAKPHPGRWPANVVLDESAAAELDRQSGTLASGKMPAGTMKGGKAAGILGEFKPQSSLNDTPGDSGGASRFFPTFRYEAKAPTVERPREDPACTVHDIRRCTICPPVAATAHPTVKPLDLMRWLVRLVTPPGGVVLEPFAGSGTTAEACVIEGFRCIAIEREATYLPLIVARLSKPIQPDLFGGAA